jgi:hypothetical protein
VSLPITVVGAGDNLVIPSTHAIANLAWTIAPAGLAPTGAGTTRIYDSSYNGGAVTFDFADAYTPYTPYVPLYFGNSTAQFVLVLGTDVLNLGATTIRKLAQDFAPGNLGPSAVGTPRIYDPIYNGAAVDFDFTAFHAYTAENVQVYFGTTTTMPVTGVGAGDESAFGVPLAYRNYQELTHIGWTGVSPRIPRVPKGWSGCSRAGAPTRGTAG